LNNINTFSKSLIINDRDVHIGASSNSVNGSYFFNGVIDDVCIYNRALSEEEIHELYGNYPCEGDFDKDGDVDGSDLALFAVDFGRTDCPLLQSQGLNNENELLKTEIENLKAELAAKEELILTLKKKMADK